MSDDDNQNQNPPLQLNRLSIGSTFIDDIIDWDEIGDYDDENSQIRKLIQWIRSSDHQEEQLSAIVNKLSSKVILYEPMMELETMEQADERSAILALRLIANEPLTPESIQEIILHLFLDRLQINSNLDYYDIQRTIIAYMIQKNELVQEITCNWYEEKIFKVADKIPIVEQNSFPHLYKQLLLISKSRQAKSLAVQALLHTIDISTLSLEEKEELIRHITNVHEICRATSNDNYPCTYNYSIFVDATPLVERILIDSPLQELQTVAVDGLIRNDIYLARDGNISTLDNAPLLTSTVKILTIARAYQNEFNFKFCQNKLEMLLDVIRQENRARVVMEASKSLTQFISKLNYHNNSVLFEDLVNEFFALLQDRHRIDVKRAIIQQLQDLSWQFLELQDMIIDRWERIIRTSSNDIAYELVDAMVHWAKADVQEDDIVNKLWKIAVATVSLNQYQMLQNYVTEELLDKKLLKIDHLKYLLESNTNLLLKKKAFQELVEQASLNAKIRQDVLNFMLSLIPIESNDGMQLLMIDTIIKVGDIKEDMATQQLLNMATQSIAIPQQTRNYIINSKHWSPHIRWTNILCYSDDVRLQCKAINQLIGLQNSTNKEKQHIEELFWDLLTKINTNTDVKIQLAEGIQKLSQESIVSFLPTHARITNDNVSRKRFIYLLIMYLNNEQLGNAILPLILSTFQESDNILSSMFQPYYRQSLDDKASNRLKFLEKALLKISNCETSV